MPVPTKPDDLSDIAHQLRTQDNLCTCEPMFCLQIKVRDWGYDDGYADVTTWFEQESGEYTEVPPETPDAKEVGYKDRWETVMVAFTNEGLEDYMRQDGHNVRARAHNGEIRVYVESFRRCDEMIRIRNFMMRPQWHSVADSLPESNNDNLMPESRQVLALYADGHMAVAYVRYDDDPDDPRPPQWTAAGRDGYTDGTVTHWRDLPNPPTEE